MLRQQSRYRRAHVGIFFLINEFLIAKRAKISVSQDLKLGMEIILARKKPVLRLPNLS